MKVIPFKPTYKRENGLIVIYDPSVPLPEGFRKHTQGIVVFPPNSKGGNHLHPRIEAFYSLGDLEIVWMERNEIKRRSMAPDKNEYFLFITLPGEPHAIVNKTSENIVMVEFADGEQKNVTAVDLA